MRAITAIIAATLLAGCGSSGAGHLTPMPPATSTAPAVSIGQPFRSGSFEIVVTEVQTGVMSIPQTNGAPFRPANGQYVIVRATAKNAGNAPAWMWSDSSTLIDVRGKSYASTGGLVLFPAVGQGFDVQQQPGTTVTGFIPFDVPEDVRSPVAVLIAPSPQDASVRVNLTQR